VAQAWKKPNESLGALVKERLIQWRRDPSTLRLDHPTRPDRAHALGFKAKEGFIVVRQRLRVAYRKRGSYLGGRRPKHARLTLILDKNYQQIAEERANKKYPNCEVLNSYWVGSDSKNHWYEVILVDTAHPQIKSDPDIRWITSNKQRGRAYRGLTSAGRKARGLRWKGFGTEKLRPSRAAYIRRKNAKQRKIDFPLNR
ncbi:MAG: 50S ribosomal protein L15e, partial [Candidatus Woesearchaeota archaeon]